jgi:DNA mismatch repair ATPase MutS
VAKPGWDLIPIVQQAYDTVGAFCQSFFEDAAFCGRTLRIAVRDLAAESARETIPTCGIPQARLDAFVARLGRARKEVHVET